MLQLLLSSWCNLIICMGLQTGDTFAYVELVKRVKIVKKVTNLFVLMTNNQSMQWKNLMLWDKSSNVSFIYKST